MTAPPQVAGAAAVGRGLSDRELHTICAETLAELPIDGRRLLVLVPDHTRHAPIARFFRILTDLALPRVRSLDFLVATGTHAPMEPERLYRHFGITPAEHAQHLSRVRFLNHQHLQVSTLAQLGVLTGHELASLTDGLMTDSVPITVNRQVLEADHILLVSPVVPHECMGFSGGNKLFFPGVAGLEFVEAFHWLAAVITNPAINGRKHTKTRALIDRVARLIPVPRTCLAFAVDGQHRVVCLYGGSPEASWSAAADVSAQLHIVTIDRPRPRVLGLTPSIYEELWVAGKAMYKLEQVVCSGGELVIYGPQIHTVSFVHQAAIERVGYHVRDYFINQWARFRSESKLILAHSTNVRGLGSHQDGIELPRIGVTLATGLPREHCERLNLGYRDFKSIDIDAWRRDPDTLVVDEAGQDLYRLRDLG